MNPEYITSQRNGDEGDRNKSTKESKESKGKEKKNSPPRQPIHLEWSLFGSKKKDIKYVVKEKPKPKRAQSVPPEPRVPYERPRPQPVPLPQPDRQSFPPQQPQPVPPFTNHPVPMPPGYPPTFQPVYPPNNFAGPSQPLRPQPEIVPIRPKKLKEEANIQVIKPKKQIKPIVIVPGRTGSRGPSTPRREHGRRDPSPDVMSPRRRPTNPSGPSDGAAAAMIVENHDRIERLETRLRQAQAELQTARRNAAQESNLRLLAEREADVRERLATLKGRQSAEQAFIDGAEARRVIDARRGPPVIEQRRPPSQERRRALRQRSPDSEKRGPRHGETTPPRSPFDWISPESPRVMRPTVYESDGDTTRRRRATSQPREPTSFGGRRLSNRTGPPVSGNWDAVRRAEDRGREPGRRRGDRPINYEDRL